MSAALSEIRGQILEIKRKIVESRDNYRLGIISGGDEIEQRIILLCRDVEQLNETDVEEIRPLIVEMLMDMKDMNEQIESQMNALRSDMEASNAAMKANVKYRKVSLANDN